MVGPEDGGPGTPACHRDGVTEEEGEEEEADIPQLCISRPSMRMTNGGLSYTLREDGSKGDTKLSNGAPRGPGPSPPSSPQTRSAASSCSSSPVSARTVAGYFVSEEADRFRFLDVTLSSRNTFEVSRRQSAPEHLNDGLSLPEGGRHPQDPDGDRPWRLGIADFFSSKYLRAKLETVLQVIESCRKRQPEPIAEIEVQSVLLKDKNRDLFSMDLA